MPTAAVNDQDASGVICWQRQRRSGLACAASRPLVALLAGLLACRAPNGKWERTQSRGRNAPTAFDAEAVRPRVDVRQRLVDAPDQTCLRVDEREGDVLLNVDAGALAVVDDLARAIGTDLLHSTLNR